MAKKVKNVVKKKNIKLSFEAISIEGGLISPEWLYKISQMEAQFQTEQDYGIHKGLNIRDEIGRYWRVANAYWNDFNQGISGSQSESISKNFISKLLKDCFGFSDITEKKEPVNINDRHYPITLIANRTTPIVITPSKQNQDIDTQLSELGDDGRKRNTYGLCQEFLNASDDASWGIATDGRTIRILRDNSSLTRPTWIDINIEKIFNEGLFSEFTTLWLLLHSSRFATHSSTNPNDSVIEKWRESSLAEGVRARDHLRAGVENAIIFLGNGFLQNSENRQIRENLQTGDLSPNQFHQELLRLVYRLIFILTAEERNLLHPISAAENAKTIYREGYSLKRLKEKSIKHSQFDHHEDIWESLKIVFKGLSSGQSRLALPALGGLFEQSQCKNIDALMIENRFILQAIFHLSWIKTSSGMNRINWRDLGSEELGSVYESLLELVPQISNNASKFSHFSEAESRGNTRKSTGSYYTPDSLVQTVLDDSLDPLILTTINQSPENAADSLLKLKILDPACGSGHFLLAAARRLASHVARLKSDGTPSSDIYRESLRLVVSNCIFGVDRNPMAIELAKISLWLEAMTPNAPLSFLDHHLVNGDALIGTMDLTILNKGIPSTAYKSLTGDDVEVCKALATENSRKLKELSKANENNNEDQINLSGFNFVKNQMQLESMPDLTTEEIALKNIALENYKSVTAQSYIRLAADMFICAFFSTKNQHTKHLIPTTSDLLKALRGILPPVNVVSFIKDTAKTVNALHWHLTFPKVFTDGGFDLVVGNPPWERVKLQEEEFFSTKDPAIANAKNASARKKMIAELSQNNPELANEWTSALRTAENESRFYRESNRYPLGGVGDVNTYAVFTDLFRQAINKYGLASLILPNGFVIGSTYQHFLKTLLSSKTLKSFYGFENRELLFADVTHKTKFGIITITGNERPIDKSFLSANIRHPRQLLDPQRRYSLSIQQIESISPNTLNIPTFNSAKDAEVTSKIHSKFPILVKRSNGKISNNPWNVRFKTVFHMSNDSELFIENSDISNLIKNRIGALAELEDGRKYYPLYEGKMFWHYDHRYGTYQGQTESNAREGVIPRVGLEDHNSPDYRIQPQYWVSEEHTIKALNDWHNKNYFFSFRELGPSERTFIGTVVPRTAINHKAPILTCNGSALEFCAFVAILSSLVVDYDARQKSNQMSLFVIEQLAVPTPEVVTSYYAWIDAPMSEWLGWRAFELLYTNWELQPLANDLKRPHSPFKWNAERRSFIQCELNAAVFHLYDLTRSQAEWIIDSFVVLKNQEEKIFSEFKTKRIVMEIFDQMENAKNSNKIYTSPLSSPPADISTVHGN